MSMLFSCLCSSSCVYVLLCGRRIRRVDEEEEEKEQEEEEEKGQRELELDMQEASHAEVNQKH